MLERGQEWKECINKLWSAFDSSKIWRMLTVTAVEIKSAVGLLLMRFKNLNGLNHFPILFHQRTTKNNDTPVPSTVTVVQCSNSHAWSIISLATVLGMLPSLGSVTLPLPAPGGGAVCHWRQLLLVQRHKNRQTSTSHLQPCGYEYVINAVGTVGWFRFITPKQH